MSRLAASLLASAVLATLTPAAIAAPPAPRVALGVFAHPDDEVLLAGTMHRLVRAGHRVRAVYVTSGDKGQDRSGRGLSGAALAAAREDETRAANRALGLFGPPRFLRFGDGAVFPALREVVAKLGEVLAEERPALLLTLGPNGVTGHADHMAVYLAVRNLRDRLASPPDLLAAVFSDRRAALFEPRWGILGVKPHAIDLRVPVDPVTARRRLGVLRAHRTQFPAEMVAAYEDATLAKDLVEEFLGSTSLAGLGATAR